MSLKKCPPCMDCLIVDDDALFRDLLTRYVEQHDDLRLVAACPSAVEAVNVLRERPVDLLFLDVEMPEMTGLELIEALGEPPQVILVTAKEDYALDAFDVDVTDYILKPVSYGRFAKAVGRAQRIAKMQAAEASGAAAGADPGYVFVRSEGRYVKLDLEDVLWIEAQGDYVLIHVASGERHMVHSTLKAMADKLPSTAFARVHRSYIVRIDRIKDIEDTTIVIERQVIPIGASFKDELLQRLNML